MESYAYVPHFDHAGRIADTPSVNKQEAATAWLRDAKPKRSTDRCTCFQNFGTDQQTLGWHKSYR